MLSRDPGIQAGLAQLESISDKDYKTLVEGTLRLLAKDARVNEDDLAGARARPPSRPPNRATRSPFPAARRFIRDAYAHHS